MAAIAAPQRIGADEFREFVGSTERQTEGSSLPSALLSLGITPFSEASVSEYKAAQVQKHTGKLGLKLDRWSLFFGSLASLFFGTAIVVLRSAQYTAAFETWALLEMIVHGMLGAFLTIIGALMVHALLKCSNSGLTRSEAIWTRIDYDKFEGFVPDNVAATATAIRAAAPNARLHIDELTVNKIPVDPFFVVSDDDDDFFTEVWDEDGFVAEPNVMH